MSSSFSANQYDNAFKSNKLQNWTVPKRYKNEPSPAEGDTIFIATDRGHLLPNVKRGCPWTSFQGTWDLPKHIPLVHINPTARSQEGQQRLRAWGHVQSPVPSPTGKLNVTNENRRTPQCEGTSDDHEYMEISKSTHAPDRPEPERPPSQTSRAQTRPTTQQSQVQSRPATQQSHVVSRPASTQSQAKSRPLTQTSNQDQ
ncbi:protein Flattop [Tachysurus fulvidraco]|uniref:protein Flattop n=1 Tax=Tachysurus fulvidraco TaxID=1234273 RepID=UPI001FEE412A|nr:protein Flattop [Tachysurus fulvidraco]